MASSQRTTVVEPRQVPRQHHHPLQRGLRQRAFPHAVEPDYARERDQVGCHRGLAPRQLQLQRRRQVGQLRQAVGIPLQVPLPHLGCTVPLVGEQPLHRGAVCGHRGVFRRREEAFPRPGNHRRGQRGHRRTPACPLQGGPRRRRQDGLRLDYQGLRDGPRALARRHSHLQRLQHLPVAAPAVHRPGAHTARRRSTHRRLRMPEPRPDGHERQQLQKCHGRDSERAEDADVQHRVRHRHRRRQPAEAALPGADSLHVGEGLLRRHHPLGLHLRRHLDHRRQLGHHPRRQGPPRHDLAAAVHADGCREERQEPLPRHEERGIGLRQARRPERHEGGTRAHRGEGPSAHEDHRTHRLLREQREDMHHDRGALHHRVHPGQHGQVQPEGRRGGYRRRNLRAPLGLHRLQPAQAL